MSVLTRYQNEVARVSRHSSALRDEKLAAHGSIQDYLGKLQPGEISSADTQDFARAFAMRHDAGLQQKQGPYSETALFVRDPDTGELVGAINFFAVARREGEDLDGIDGMSQLNYLFVDERYRKMGIGSYLVEAAEQASRAFIREHGPPP